MAHEILLVTGKPYSGKTSLSSRFALKNDPIARHLSIGDRLRAIGSGSIESAYSEMLTANKKTLMEHMPVPKEAVLGVFKEFVTEQPSGLIIVDGYPSYPDRIAGFKEAVTQLGADVIAVCNVEVNDDVVRSRSGIREQRYADNSEDIDFVNRRLDNYLNNTLPVIKILANDYPYYILDGTQTFDDNIHTLKEIYQANTTNQD